MTFVFQQPGAAKLLEALNSCSLNAEAGGGVFAFASKGGVDAVFDLPNIKSMLAEGRQFHVIVGIDAITNAEALLCLGEKVSKYGKTLIAHVFLHAQAPSTFHPKFSWFKKNGGMSLITGSGNLTERGLGKQPASGGQSGNWEAFSIQTLTGAEADSASNEISQWLAAQKTAGTLCSLDDSRVLEKAMANGQVRYTTGWKRLSKPKGETKLPAPAFAKAALGAVGAGNGLDTLDVLIRELPKNRSGQGDIGQKALNEFFGHQGTDKHIFMQYVDLSDTLYPVRNVWLFFNSASDNYRLELPESKGNYEIGTKDERMILVAVKFDTRSFRYTILRPKADEKHYEKVSSLLGPVQGKRRLMRELFTSTDNLLDAWHNAPANLLPVQLPTPEP